MGKNTDFQKELVSEFRSQKLTTEPTYLETVNATFCRLKRHPPPPPTLWAVWGPPREVLSGRCCGVCVAGWDAPQCSRRHGPYDAPWRIQSWETMLRWKSKSLIFSKNLKLKSDFWLHHVINGHSPPAPLRLTRQQSRRESSCAQHDTPSWRATCSAFCNANADN